ncbi:MAG: ribonuclease HI [Clostridia bacterium]|nr:ribonuclease HI [Clostridia bacterium]
MKEIILYTDGACSGNPGPGGWGCILFYTDNSGVEHKLEMNGGDPDTTNNRMELLAVIEGIKKLNQPCVITVYSDSQYVCNAFNKGWLKGWQKKGWVNSAKEPVKNIDLWKLYLQVSAQHQVSFVNVKGHSDNVYNNRCDELARAAISQFRK